MTDPKIAADASHDIEEQIERPGAGNVIWLGLVSLFTDLSSAMIRPLVPLFLRGIGTPNVGIGTVEGAAESAASILRTFFGRWSDKVGKRKIFVFCGYGLSSVTKPFLALAGVWPTVLVLKFVERVGKAVRTPARDALISLSVSEEKKGSAFGFHRAMDRIGAIGGPLLAYAIIRALGITGQMTEGGVTPEAVSAIRWTFALSFIPAALALIFIPFARDAKIPTREGEDREATGLRDPAFVVFVIASVVFTLGQSSKALLVLKPEELGADIGTILLMWAFYNVFCTVSSPILGHISDLIGRAPVIIVSFFYFAIVYLFFGLASQLSHIWALFAAFGVYYGLSDGIFRAYIADLVRPEVRATAYGIYNSAVGVTTFFSSLIFMSIWGIFGSKYAFFTGAGFSMAGFLIFIADLAVRAKDGKT